jgi:hypothetical protein
VRSFGLCIVVKNICCITDVRFFFVVTLHDLNRDCIHLGSMTSCDVPRCAVASSEFRMAVKIILFL